MDQWELGDAALELFGDKGKSTELKDWAEEQGIGRPYAVQCREVSRLFPDPEERTRYGLSWAFYRAVRKLEDPHRWLAEAKEKGWSVEDLRMACGATSKVCTNCEGHLTAGPLTVTRDGRKIGVFCSDGCLLAHFSKGM